MTSAALLTDLQVKLALEREPLEEEAVATGYTGDRETMIKFLKAALATELICVLRYRRHHFMARGIHLQSEAQEFLEHANVELSHADKLAKRIIKLGGEPELSPNMLTGHCHAEYVEDDTLSSMIRENLVAERLAIDSYRSLIHHLGNKDRTTRRLLEAILEWKVNMLTNWLTCWWHCLRSASGNSPVVIVRS